MHLFRAWHIVNTEEILATVVFCGWFTPQPESLTVPKFAGSFLLVHTSLPGPGMPYSFFLPLTVTIPFPSEVSSTKKIFLGVVLYHLSPPLHRHSLLELFGHTSIWNMNLITICFLRQQPVESYRHLFAKFNYNFRNGSLQTYAK